MYNIEVYRSAFAVRVFARYNGKTLYRKYVFAEHNRILRALRLDPDIICNELHEIYDGKEFGELRAKASKRFELVGYAKRSWYGEETAWKE